MAEASSASPSSQPAPVSRPATPEPDHLDLERGSARQSVRHSSSNRQNSSEPRDFFHLFKEDKNPSKIAQLPPGWVRIAAEHNNYYNYNAKEAEIDELLYGPDGDERFTLREPLFAETLEVALKYDRLLQMDNELRELPAAHADQHYGAYEHMRRFHHLSEADSAYMLRYEDMVQPKTDASDVVLKLITNDLGGSRARKWMKKAVYFLFGYRGHGDDGIPNNHDRPLQALNISRMRSVISLVMMVVGELVLLTPVLVLYLVPMQKGATAGTVVAFVFVLTPIIYISRNTRFAEAVVGLVSFLAVVVAFLAQLGNGSCSCP